MNYFEIHKNYWKLRIKGEITAAEGDLYLYLVHVCNADYWKNPFSYRTSDVCKDLGITRPTLAARRIRLQELNLIRFEEGNTNIKPPLYEILSVSKSAAGLPPIASAGLAAALMDEQADDTIRNEEVPKHIERPHEVHTGRIEYTLDMLIGSDRMNEIAMHAGITRQIADTLLDQLIKENEVVGKTYKTLSGMRSHFLSYCKESKTKKYSPPSYSSGGKEIKGKPK